MEELLAQPALRFSGEHHDVADVVLAGLLAGKWQALEARTARGLGLAKDRGGEVSLDEVEAALATFRYARRLLAAADLRDWLSGRSLGVRELRDVLQRSLLRERFMDASCSTVSAEEVAAVIWAEATCTGELGRYLEELRAWHAAEAGLAEMKIGPVSRASPSAHRIEEATAAALADAPSGLRVLGRAQLRSRVARLCALQSAYGDFCATAVSEEEVDARLGARRVDWTIVTGNELSFELEGAARETRLRVAHDGGTLAEVAAMLARTPAPRTVELGSAPAELSSELLRAGAGDLVGPWNEHERWRVFEIDGRVEPDSSTTAQARARDELLSELLERLTAGKAGVLAAF